MEKSHLNQLNQFLVSILFLMGLVASFFYKQIFLDGASWVYRIVNFKEWILDEPYRRYSSALLHTPVVLLAKIGAPVTLIYWVYCLCYLIYPFIALIILERYLKRKARPDLIYPLIISFFLAILPTWGFANSIACEAIVLFWFLFIYIIVEEKPTLRLLFIPALLLLLSYETGLIFFALSIWLLWRENKLTKLNFSFFATLIFIQILNLFMFVSPGNGFSDVKPSLSYAFRTPLWLPILFFFPAIFLLTADDNKRIKQFILILSGLISAATIYLLYELDVEKIWMHSYSNRVWSIPVAFLILFFSYEYLKKKEFKFDTMELAIILFLLLPGLMIEGKTSLHSYRVMNRIESLTINNQGCNVLDKENLDPIIRKKALSSWDFPFLSLIFNKSYQIKSLLFIDNIEPKVFCTLSPRGMDLLYSRGNVVHQIYIKGSYDFSEFLKSK